MQYEIVSVVSLDYGAGTFEVRCVEDGAEIYLAAFRNRVDAELFVKAKGRAAVELPGISTDEERQAYIDSVLAKLGPCEYTDISKSGIEYWIEKQSKESAPGYCAAVLREALPEPDAILEKSPFADLVTDTLKGMPPPSNRELFAEADALLEIVDRLKGK